MRSNHEIDYRIFGEEMQCVEVELDPQETVIAEAGAFMYKDQAIQMQTIVNLVSAELGLAWVPASVQQFQRPGVVYRQVEATGSAVALPACETSLVWPDSSANPTLARWMECAPPSAQAQSRPC